MSAAAPRVTVLIAAYNSARFLAVAVGSAARQTLPDIEILIADDASTDDTAAIAIRLAAADPRIRFLPASANGGPGATRNRALAEARGDWIAILDSDDLIHPDRLRRLLAAAAAHDADIVADDLILFDNDRRGRPRRFLEPPETEAPFALTPARYLAQTRLYGAKPNLGFLKPVIRRDAMRAAGVRYDDRLRIGEDDDLVTQLLAAGLRYWVVPSPLYYYRKHGGSISHRTTPVELDAMLAAAARVAARFPSPDAATARSLERRARALADARAFDEALAAIKARDVLAAFAAIRRRPRAALLAWMPIMARIERRRARRRSSARAAGGRDVLFVSRQRIVGRTNGSSTYLLDLAMALRGAGFVPHLLQPSPSVVGRRAILRLSRDLDVFASHRIRGVWRLGRIVVSREAHVWRAAAAGIAARLRARGGAQPGGAFPHTIAMPWSDADRVFLAAHGHDRADLILADYVFQAEAIPALIRPDAPSAIVMHDLYAARSGTFGAAAARDSVELDRAGEIALLGAADAVIAIQRTEAAWVVAHVPRTRVIVAPMAAAPVAAPQPGADDRLLFVGSNAPPNALALEWLFREIWPLVRAARPRARLDVAGSIRDAFARGAPAGVSLLGVVADLTPLYRDAGIVISPLTAGSGLKIKLVEALAQGKAIVATSVTLQGVEDQAGPAVIRADTAAAFADGIVGLAGDAAWRGRLAAAALAAAHAHFSAAACYGPLLRWAGDAAVRGSAGHRR